MIPFFVLLGLIIILFALLLYGAVIEIDVKRFVINTENKTIHYLIYIKLKIINKITVVKLKIDNKKIEKYKNTNNRLIKKITSKLQGSLLKTKHIKELKIKLKRIKLNVEISLLNPFLTSICIGVISTIISVIIANTLKDYKYQNCIYKIEPIYDDEIKVKLNLICTINIKIVHIMNTFISVNKKQNKVQTNNKNIAKSKI